MNKFFDNVFGNKSYKYDRYRYRSECLHDTGDITCLLHSGDKRKRYQYKHRYNILDDEYSQGYLAIELVGVSTIGDQLDNDDGRTEREPYRQEQCRQPIISHQESDTHTYSGGKYHLPYSGDE
jgi:hypothetical protein